jgi:hypothetical protein
MQDVMMRLDHMAALRTLVGLALGVAMAFAVLDARFAGRLSQGVHAAVEWAVELVQGDGKADVAVAFDRDGRVVSSALVRSTGSGLTDEAARDAALQLASLEPPGQVAGRTRIYRTTFCAALD